MKFPNIEVQPHWLATLERAARVMPNVKCVCYAITNGVKPEIEQEIREAISKAIAPYTIVNSWYLNETGTDLQTSQEYRIAWLNHMIEQCLEMQGEGETMFKVGQKVWCVMYGAGVVTGDHSEDTNYPIEVRFGGVLGYYTLDGKYRTYATQPTLFPYPVEIVKKVVKPSIDWDHVAPKYKYFSEDSEGNAFLYEEEPYVAIGASAWYARSNEVVEANGFASYVKGTCDWKDSLIERPDSA